MKIAVLEYLRGMAALLVVLYHYNGRMLPSVGGTFLTDISYYGSYGVHVFFIISGYVIPLSLVRGSYSIRYFPNWFFRRIIRIAPPAYVIVLLTILFYFLSMWYLGRPIRGMNWPGLSWESTLTNLTFTVEFFETSWFNIVFWTLGIEFQFYILAGFLVGIIWSRPRFIFLLLLAGFFLAYLPYETVFDYMSLFVLGMGQFLFDNKKMSPNGHSLLVVTALIACYYQIDLIAAGAALITLMAIRFSPHFHSGLFLFLGTISYSLYIIHPLTGTVMEIIIKQFFVPQSVTMKIFMMAVYVFSAILLAKVFYGIFERPSIYWSKRLKSEYVPATKEKAN